MKICGLEKCSMVDFDGNLACTIFTEGCNFVCPFCHNSSLVVPQNVPNTYLPEQEVFAYLEKRKNMLDALCITGGEPTLQPDLPDFIRKVRELGYKIKLDTNGTNPQMLEYLIEQHLVDYVAMDIKSYLENYGQLVGIANYKTDKVEKSIAILQKKLVPFEFRTTLINEFHKIEDFEKIGKLIAKAPNYFLQKFKDEGHCITNNLSAVPQESAKKIVEIMEQYVDNVSLRGYN